MFSLKKIALVGVAGFAAFSMSCSDTKDDPGGSWAAPFTAEIDPNGGFVVIGGEIKADEGNQIIAVNATADGATVELSPAPTVPASTVDLTETDVLGVCNATGTTTGSKEVTIKIVAKFDDGADISDSKKVTVNCTGADVDPELKKENIKLSSADDSYADLDTYTTMKEAVAKTKLKDIDLIAYCGTSIGCETGTIFSPLDVDIFWNGETYLGGDVMFYKITPAQATTLRNATKLSDVAEFLKSFDADEDDEIDDFTITNGEGFIVSTTGANLRAVVVTGSAATAVDLNVTGFE